MRIDKYFVVLLLLLLVASCAPIDGLDPQEVPEETTVTQVVTTTTTAPPPTTTQAAVVQQKPNYKFVKITADALNVRSVGSMEGNILTKIYENQIYEILDEAEDSDGLLWYEINAPDGIKGWVSSDYCLGGETYQELMDE